MLSVYNLTSSGACEQVLVELLLLACDPRMVAAARMQQCLAIFFRAYAGQSKLAHKHLCAAALPAARRAHSIGPLAAKSAAPQLLKFVLSLLQARHAILRIPICNARLVCLTTTKNLCISAGRDLSEHISTCTQQDQMKHAILKSYVALQTAVAMEAPVAGCPEAALAEEALKEALACPPGSAAKALHAGLLKLAAGLDLQGASQVSRCLPCLPQSLSGRRMHVWWDNGRLLAFLCALRTNGGAQA